MVNSAVMDASESLMPHLWKAVNHLLWPARCMNCARRRSESDPWLCRVCWDDLLWCTAGTFCPRCGRDASLYGLVEGACADCLGKETWLDGMVRCGVYDKALRDMILAFKNGRTEMDVVFSRLANSAFQASPFFDRVDVLAPVPLHWTRRLQRGYNQAAVVAARLRHPCARVCRLLVRMRRTSPQPSMSSPSGRARNVRDAFGVPRRAHVEGRTICLVDDIKTTGATLNECARTLKRAGARQVYGLVLAVAGQTRGAK